ncbi:MAG: hypothetical protein HY342_11830 [Candidatus Lambdaproteobacteria bacterium]|nr:hypothetical protein [Candidatus Lambdaproteobacteria bacterium]
MTQDDKHTQQEGESGGNGGRGNLTELYERMSKLVRERMERAGAITEETLERALKESQELAAKFKLNYGDDVAKVADFVKRDWYEAIRLTRDQSRRSFDLDRLQVGILGLLSRFAETAGNQLESFARRVNERLTYKTGEIAGAGTLECQQCHQHLNFDKATRIPPCPKCRGTIYRRSF